MTAAATPTTAKIADLLADGQARTAREIADATGAGFSTVGKALNTMADAGDVIRPSKSHGTAGRWISATSAAVIVADEAAPEAVEVDEAPDASVDAILDQLAGVGRDSREVEAELDAAAAERAAKPSQDDRILAALGMTESELAIDVVATMHTVGATVEMTDTMAMPADGPAIGDLVAVYAHQRVRVARVWNVTPTKLSAVYTTPSEVDAAARVNRAASWNNITAKIADCGLVRSAGVATTATRAAKTSGGAVANGTLTAMGRGDLRAAVMAYLTANPTLEITPAKLAKALGGRSSGAVAKGLVKLVEAGTVVQTSEAPRTYRLA